MNINNFEISRCMASVKQLRSALNCFDTTSFLAVLQHNPSLVTHLFTLYIFIPTSHIDCALFFSSTVLRWSPEAQSQINKDGGIVCNILVIAIDAIATGWYFHFLKFYIVFGACGLNSYLNLWQMFVGGSLTALHFSLRFLLSMDKSCIIYPKSLFP